MWQVDARLLRRRRADAIDVADRLELSGVSHLLSTLKANGDVRTEKVAQIKAMVGAVT